MIGVGCARKLEIDQIIRLLEYSETHSQLGVNLAIPTFQIKSRVKALCAACAAFWQSIRPRKSFALLITTLGCEVGGPFSARGIN